MTPIKSPGLFITFEGIDGAGKTTHIEATVAAFRAQGRVVCQTREPGGTPLAEKLRALVLNDAMDPLTEALLIFAARRDHLQQVIEPALSSGEVVVCDRFTDATFAYQGGGRGFDLPTLAALETMVQGARQPDATVWFDLDPAIAAARLADARLPDRFESQPLAFFQAVAEAYALRAQSSAGRFIRIDAAQARETVADAVMQALVSRGYLNDSARHGLKR